MNEQNYVLEDAETYAAAQKAAADVAAAEAFNMKLRRMVVIKGLLEANKPLYEELDALVVAIAGAVRPGCTTILEGQAFTLVDNFEVKNTVFRPAGVRRFEVDIETIEEFNERLVKNAKKAAKAAAKGAS